MATGTKEKDDVKAQDDAGGSAGDGKGADKKDSKASPIVVELEGGKTLTFANHDEMTAKLKELAKHEDAAKKLGDTEAVLGQIVKAYRDPKDIEASTAYFMRIGGHSPAEARKMAEQRAANAARANADPDDEDEEDDDDDDDTPPVKKGSKKSSTPPPPERKIGIRDLDPEFQRQLGGMLHISSDAAQLIEENNTLHVQNAIQADQVLREYWEALKPKQKAHLLDKVRFETGAGKGVKLNAQSLMKGIQAGREFAVSMWDTPSGRGSRTGSGHDLITGENYHTDDTILDEISADDPFVSSSAAFKKRGIDEPEDRHAKTQAALEAIHRDLGRKERSRPR